MSDAGSIGSSAKILSMPVVKLNVNAVTLGDVASCMKLVACTAVSPVAATVEPSLATVTVVSAEI